MAKTRVYLTFFVSHIRKFLRKFSTGPDKYLCNTELYLGDLVHLVRLFNIWLSTTLVCEVQVYLTCAVEVESRWKYNLPWYLHCLHIINYTHTLKHDIVLKLIIKNLIVK